MNNVKCTKQSLNCKFWGLCVNSKLLLKYEEEGMGIFIGNSTVILRNGGY